MFVVDELISMLNSDNGQGAQLEAIRQLTSMVDTFWTEVADSITQLEELFEDEHFSAKDEAAFLLSKVYYHLGDYQLSLSYAIHAGSLIEWTGTSEFVQVLKGEVISLQGFYIGLEWAT